MFRSFLVPPRPPDSMLLNRGTTLPNTKIFASGVSASANATNIEFGGAGGAGKQEDNYLHPTFEKLDH